MDDESPNSNSQGGEQQAFLPAVDVTGLLGLVAAYKATMMYVEPLHIVVRM